MFCHGAIELLDYLDKLKHSPSKQEDKKLLKDIQQIFFDCSNWDQLEYYIATIFDPHDGAFYILKNCEISQWSRKKLLNILTFIAKKFPSLLSIHAALISDFLNSFINSLPYYEEHDALFIIEMFTALPLKFIDVQKISFSVFHEKIHLFHDPNHKNKKNLCQVISFLLENFSDLVLGDEEIENLCACVGSLLEFEIDQYVLKCLKYLATSHFNKLSQHINIDGIFQIIRNSKNDGKNSEISADICDVYFENTEFSIHHIRRLGGIIDFYLSSDSSHLLRARCVHYYTKLLFQHCKDEFITKILAEEQSEFDFLKVFQLKLALSCGSVGFEERLTLHQQTRFFDHIFLSLIQRLDSDKLKTDGDNMELMLILCEKNQNYFYDNQNLIKRILSSMIVSYKDARSIEEHVKHIFLSLYTFDKFHVNLFPLIYNSIISQCTHQWISDYDLIKNKEGYTSYHNYIQLWAHLMSFKPKFCVIETENLNKFHYKIKKLFITSILRTFDDYVKPHHFDNAIDHSYDITIFENCASLFSIVISNLDKKPKIYVLQKLIFEATQFSLIYPFINGFYTIISTCFNIFNLHKDQFEKNKEIKRVVVNYLKIMLKNKVIFDEILPGLVETVLSIPICLIAQFQIEISGYFKNLIKNQKYGVGMIERCLDAIVCWVDSLGNRKLESFLIELLPSLRSVVLIEEEVSQNGTWKVAHNSFERFIQLITSLPRNICERILTADSSGDVDFQVVLKVPIVLNAPTNFTFKMDEIIRYVSFLAYETAIGEKRQLTFESLHSFSLFCLGMMSKDLDLCSIQEYQNFLFNLIETIVFSLCALQSDALQMFEDFLLEICHLFVTRPNYYSCFSTKLIDILMRGISNENLESRKLSLKCLKEFALWSYQNYGDVSNSVSCRHLLTSTISFSFLHVSFSLRIGAAKAFNCIADIYLKEREYVNKYSIYVLTFMISSLERYDELNYELSTSLQHLESAMIGCSEILLSKAEEREQPHEIEYATMECLFDWILEKCTSLSFECRKTSLKFMTSFCQIYGDEIMNRPLSLKFSNFIERFENVQKSRIPLICAIIDYYHFNVENNKKLNLVPLFVLDAIEAFLRFYQTDSFDQNDKNLFQKCNTAWKIIKILKFSVMKSEKMAFSQDLICRILLWFFEDRRVLEENDLKDILFLFEQPSVQKVAKKKIYERYNDMISLLLNSIDLNQNLFLFSTNNCFGSLEGFRVYKERIEQSKNNLVKFSSSQIIDKMILVRLDEICDKCDVITCVLKTSLSMDLQDTSWFWNTFCCQIENPDDVFSTPKFKFFFLFKDLFCDYILQNEETDVGNLSDTLKLAVLKEILDFSSGSQKYNSFGNIVLKSVSSKWSHLRNWLKSDSRKNLFIDFLYHLSKSLRVSWHRKSEIFIFLRASSDVINYKKHFFESNRDNEVNLFTIFKYSLNFNLMSDVCFWIINVDNREVDFEEISTFLLSSSLTVEIQSFLLHDLFDVGISNEGSMDKRLELIKAVFIPLCYKSDYNAIFNFYLSQLQKLCEIVFNKLEPPSFPDEEFVKIICQKTICYVVLESMFGVLKEHDVLKCFTHGFTKNYPSLPKDLLRNTYSIRKLKPQVLGGKDYSNHWRYLQCAAFNLGISIVCNRSENSIKGKFYDKYVFNFHKKWFWILWENVTYKQEFKFSSYNEHYEKVKVLTSLKYKRDKKIMLKRNKYVKSVSLNLPSSTTHSQHCKTYDFIGKSCVPINNEELDDVEYDFKEFELLRDSINTHECMGNLCGAIHQTVYDGFTQLEDTSVLPNWMKPFFLSLASNELDNNGKLFILKVIFNCRDIFKPFALRFIDGVAKTVLLIPPLANLKLNQFLNDCVLMLISWKNIASPNTKYVWRLIEKLLPPPDTFLDKSDMKQNSILIKKIFDSWLVSNPDLSIVEKLIKSSHEVNNLLGLEVLKLILTYKINDLNEAQMTEFFERFLPELRSKNHEIYAEIIGLILRSDSHFSATKSVKVKECLLTLFIKDPLKYAQVLYKIQKNFLMSAENFLPWVMKCLDNPKSVQAHPTCLDVLNEFLTKSSDIDEYLIEKLNKIFLSVKSENGKVQRIVLEILLTCFEKFGEQFLPSVVFENFAFLIRESGKNEKMRSTLCNLLICINTSRSLDVSMDGIQKESDGGLDYLFSRLFDPCLTIRTEVFRFWMNYLSSMEIHKIFIFLMEYSLKSESNSKMFFGFLVNLIMRIIEKRKSFDEKIFNSSLVNCSYKEKSVDPYKAIRPQPLIPPFVKLADFASSKSDSNQDVNKYIYYHGDYPRTDIMYSDVLNPLLSLCQVDDDLAKKVLMVLMSGLLSEFKNNSFWDDFEIKFANLLQNFPQIGPSKQHSFILELSIRNNINLNTNVAITEIFAMNNIEELGILFIENAIMSEQEVVENPSKRLKFDPNFNDDKADIQKLIRLYLTINEDEIAEDIFTDHYVKENKSDDFLHSLFSLKAMEKISNWDTLNKSLKQFDVSCETLQVKRDYFPYLVKSSVHQALIGNVEASLSSRIKDWAGYLQEEAEISLLYSSIGDFSKLSLHSKLSLKSHLSNMNIIRSKGHEYDFIIKLKSLADIYMCLGRRSFISNHFIDDYDDCHKSRLCSHSHLEYRAYCRELSYIKEVEIPDRNLSWIVDIIDFAVSKKNFYMARKYWAKLFKKMKDSVIADIKKNEVFLLKLESKNSSEKGAELKKYWDQLENLIKRTQNEENSHSSHLTLYISNLCSQLLKSEIDPLPFSDHIRKDLSSLIPFFKEKTNSKCAKESVFELGFDCLMGRARESSQKGKAYLSAAVYCRNNLKYSKGFPSYKSTLKVSFVNSVLSAMAFGNIEAQKLFPAILNLTEVLKDSDCHTKILQIPPHMFLQWIPQLFTVLSRHSFVMNLMEIIFTEYPERVCIPFFLWKETSCKSDKLISMKLYSKAPECLHLTEKIIEGLSQLCHPNLLLISYLKDLQESYKTKSDVSSLYDKIVSNCFYRSNGGKNQLVGKIYEKNNVHESFIMMLKNDCKTEGEKCDLLRIKINEIEKNIEDIDEQRLDQYSPWLAYFSPQKGKFEVPVSNSLIDYKSDSPSLVRFDTKVQKITSLRSPMKINMYGSDGKRYSWLVKFGEDIRQDQRIMQLFESMNHSLKHESSTDCKISTYQVIPLKSKLGLIEFLPYPTISKFLNTMDSSLHSKRMNIKKEHEKWMRKKLELCVLNIENHDKAIANHYEMCCRQIPSQILRNALLNKSTSPQHFYNLRLNFLKTYSVLCIAHWILGIGDRHLSNFLISTSQCDVIGIDYGHAFDVKNIFSPPELIPFRMSPHFFELYAPLGKSGVLHHYMAATLDSLDNDVIIWILKLFIQEPNTLDYLSKTNMLKSIVNRVELKLKKENPIFLLENLLKDGFLNKGDAEVYCNLLKSEFGQQETLNSSKKLVDSLIEIATNKTIIGLMPSIFEGWI